MTWGPRVVPRRREGQAACLSEVGCKLAACPTSFWGQVWSPLLDIYVRELFGVFKNTDEAEIDAAEGPAISPAKVFLAGELSNEDAADLYGIAAGQRAVNLRIVLAGVADEQKPAAGKHLQKAADDSELAAAAEHQDAAEQMVAEAEKF